MAAVGATVTVKWGYDTHSIELTQDNWAKIKAGQAVYLHGSGYDYEGDFFQDRWTFNAESVGELVVTYGEDGGVGFDGTLDAAVVEEHLPSP